MWLPKSFITCQIVKHLGCRNKSFNSAEWLNRRNHDIYTEKAKRENYRCRSAYKLLEINDRFNLVRHGHVVLDVGAAPGSWSQVLANKTNSNGYDKHSPRGIVVSVDLLHIYPIEGVTILSKLDFTDKYSQQKILEVLGKSKLDYIFSDMAPMASGVKSLDQEAIVNLVYPVLLFAVKHLTIGGGCLIKIWEGRHQSIVKEFKRFFKIVNNVKPNATYSNSSESYLLGRDFFGIKNKTNLVI